MSKKVLNAVVRLADVSLSIDEKAYLAKHLSQETTKIRWERLLADIDRRRKGRQFTMAEIQREIDAVRLERRGVNHSRRR